MAFPTGTMTSTSLANVIPSLWGQKINEFYRAKLVMAPFFTDRSAELAGGGNVLYTPSVSELSASSKTNATAVNLQGPTDAKVTLTVNQWYESSFAIEDAEAAQVMHSYAIMERYAKSAAFAIAKTLDVALANLFPGFSTTAGSSTATLVDSVIRSAIASMEAANVDLDECAFFVDPKVFWNQIQGIDKFSLAVNSPVNDPTAKRPNGHLYGIPVYTSNNIRYVVVSGSAGRYNALAHPDALHWATSPLGAGGSEGQFVGANGIRVQSNYMPDYLSTVTTADILYGVIENRDAGGVAILTSAA
jgi:hypothetical protein